MDITGNKAKVFWTGGWDSTFEMCRLSLKPIKVQPVYLVLDRPYHVGQEYEMKAQDRILKLLRERDTTMADILPLLRVPVKDIAVPKSVRDVFGKINGTYEKLGSQYYYFASYAYRHQGMRVMISDYWHSVSRTMRYIRQCNCKFDDERVMYIVRKGSDPGFYDLFGRCLFPLADFGQDYIVKWIDDNGFWDVMKEVWTCYYPIDGKPCGFCHACSIKVKQHLDFLVGDEAKKRAFVYNYLCSKYEFTKPRLPAMFAIWLRNRYNPEMAGLPLRYDGFVYPKEKMVAYHKVFQSYFSEERREKLKPLEPYFEELLASGIEYRNMRDRMQLLGIV